MGYFWKFFSNFWVFFGFSRELSEIFLVNFGSFGAEKCWKCVFARKTGKSTSSHLLVELSFAVKSLCASTRSVKLKILSENRYLQAVIAVGLSLLLIITDGRGSGGLKLWPLFGSTNQLLGSLALLVISVWLFKLKRKFWITLTPMIFITLVTFLATYHNFANYVKSENWLLVAIAFIIGACQLWIIFEGIKAFKTEKNIGN